MLVVIGEIFSILRPKGSYRYEGGQIHVRVVHMRRRIVHQYEAAAEPLGIAI
jgi:hypothetical protein